MPEGQIYLAAVDCDNVNIEPNVSVFFVISLNNKKNLNYVKVIGFVGKWTSMSAWLQMRRWILRGSVVI
jgi:hypothetical protein